jgi:hypothetical protein
MELFIHTPGNEHPAIVEVEETVVIRTLVAEGDGDDHIWLEETEEEVDLELTFAAAGIGHHHHVHKGRCRTVEVTVRWNGNHEQTYAPATTIATVEKWAFHEVAHFSPEQAAQHVLAEPGADHFLAGGVHVGSLVKPGSCGVTLDLLPRSRFQG